MGGMSQLNTNFMEEADCPSVSVKSTNDTAWSVMDQTMDKVLGSREGLNQLKIRDVIGAIDKEQGHSELRNYYYKAK